jgi:hypothetical protein
MIYLTFYLALRSSQKMDSQHLEIPADGESVELPVEHRWRGVRQG